jgi:hypothetical protein
LDLHYLFFRLCQRLLGGLPLLEHLSAGLVGAPPGADIESVGQDADDREQGRPRGQPGEQARRAFQPVLQALAEGRIGGVQERLRVELPLQVLVEVAGRGVAPVRVGGQAAGQDGRDGRRHVGVVVADRDRRPAALGDELHHHLLDTLGVRSAERERVAAGE